VELYLLSPIRVCVVVLNKDTDGLPCKTSVLLLCQHTVAALYTNSQPRLRGSN
jgi:hypothetical protein